MSMTENDLSTENASLREEIATTKVILDGIADAVMVANEKGDIIHWNATAAAFSKHLDPKAWRESDGVFRRDGVTPMQVAEYPLSRALRGEDVLHEELFCRNQTYPDGIWLQCDARPIYGKDGALRGGVTMYRDITERKRFEQQMERQLIREKEKSELLERMRNAIEQLSTPILEVWDDVLAIPVIGVVDSTRAADMMARVLEAVERKQCRFLIIDITGVDVIDTATADRFLKLVTAVEILGARCFLTGARAVVAHTLASLGMELSGLTTLRTLKHGLSECIRAMEQVSKQPQLRELLLKAGSNHG
jgi:rsbT co-antagonist protein RsbR